MENILITTALVVILSSLVYNIYRYALKVLRNG